MIFRDHCVGEKQPSSWKSFQSVEIVANGVEPQVGGQTGLIGAQINTLQLHDDDR